MSDLPPMRRTRKRPVEQPPAQAAPEPNPPPDVDFTPAGEPEKEETGGLPPHSIEAEQGVLGCILLDSSNSIGACIAAFKAGGMVFFDLKHRTIYETCVTMWDQQIPIDVITLQHALRAIASLEGVGGLVYISSLPDKVPSASNLPHYIDIVQKKFVLRRLLTACVDLQGQIQKEPDNVQEIVVSAAAAMESAGDVVATDAVISTPKTLIPEALHFIEHLKQNAGNVTGISTGLVDLDVMTWGLQPSELIILAARPGIGKTSMSLGIAEHVAAELKNAVAFFSLEMSKESLALRMLCSRARVSASDVRRGFSSAKGDESILKAGAALVKMPLYIDDSSGLSILQLRARARRMVKQYGIKLVIIDYLQLMTAPTRRNDNRQQEVAAISGGLKALAKEEKIPVLVLAQLNRKVEDRGGNARPKISDLRESGSLEADADVILLLYQSKADKDESGVSQVNHSITKATVNVAKNRNGPTGEVDLLFFPGWTRFESASKVVESDSKAENLVSLFPDES